MPVKEYHDAYLLEAVDSMLSQTGPDWRLLVIGEDPGARRLEQVLAEHLADPRIELIVNEGRKLAGAFNTGMRRAETEFVAILLGDDLWAPEAVEVLTAAIAEFPDTDFFHSLTPVHRRARAGPSARSTRAGRTVSRRRLRGLLARQAPALLAAREGARDRRAWTSR